MIYLIKKGDDKRMATMGIGTIERYLRDVNYPADKNEIVNNARRQNAPVDIVKNFDMLPDKRYNSAEDVWKDMEKSFRMGMGSESSSRTESSSQQRRY